MENHTVFDDSIELGEFELLGKVVEILSPLYFEQKLSKTELKFFTICLLGIRRGYSNPFEKGFYDLFVEHYFSPNSTKAQRASLLCTQRKNLMDKDYLVYDKNISKIVVSPVWPVKSNEVTIKIKLSISEE